MKKILLSLTVISSLFLVSCEDEFAPESSDNNENITNQANDSNQTTNGYWEYNCTTVYDSVEVISCDSSIMNFNSGVQVIRQVCDSILMWDSLQIPYYRLDCRIICEFDSSIVVDPVHCVTTYKVVETEVCDSVWVEDTSGNNGSDNDSTIIVGNWHLECDSTLNPNQQWVFNCDSIWVQ